MGRIRIGIDVGGTFTKAVAVDDELGVIGKAVVPTSYDSAYGISSGIVEALTKLLRDTGIDPRDVRLVAFTTTHNVNALLEGDTSRVGLVVMSKSEYAGKALEITRRSELKVSPHKSIEIIYKFIDTTQGLSPGDAGKLIDELVRRGAEALAVNEAFGVDDPRNEELIVEEAWRRGVPAISGHELSLLYGLEVRAITSVVNASIIPKMVSVAESIERGARKLGIDSMIAVVKADGGITGLDTLKKKPVYTLLSGPAASMIGALYYMSAFNAVVVEVGGTSTNVGIVKEGSVPTDYIRVMDYPLAVRGVDVLVIGVAGGSMPRVMDGEIVGVGPRSAHISGLRYSVFAEPREIEDGSVDIVSPIEGDPRQYPVITSRGGRFAVTVTCAAAALGVIPREVGFKGNRDSALIALGLLSRYLRTSAEDLARRILDLASIEIIEAVKYMARKHDLELSKAKILGGGGGALALVPYVALKLGVPYEVGDNADVISALGAAIGVISESVEVSSTTLAKHGLAELMNLVYSAVVEKGGDPSTITITSERIPGKKSVRIVAVGMMPLRKAGPRAIDRSEALRIAGSILEAPGDGISVFMESKYYVLGYKRKSVIPGLGNGQVSLVVLDRTGRVLLKARKAELYKDEGGDVLDTLKKRLKGSLIAPEIYVVDNEKFIDLSFIASPKQLVQALESVLRDHKGRALVIVKRG